MGKDPITTTFGLAKLAKQKGFSLGSTNVFIQYSDDSIGEEVNYYTINNKKGFDLSCKGFDVYEKPKLYELQTWLRDEHSLEFEIKITKINDNPKNYSIYLVKSDEYSIGLTNKTIFGMHAFQSYELALLVGIEVTLKDFVNDVN